MDKICSLRIIFEKIIAVSGTTKIYELAFIAPILDDAKKYGGLTAEKAGEVANRIQELLWRIDDENEVWR